MMLAMEHVEPETAAPKAAVAAAAPARTETARVVPAPRGVQMARKPLATV
jgi:hypothetical protein